MSEQSKLPKVISEPIGKFMTPEGRVVYGRELYQSIGEGVEGAEGSIMSERETQRMKDAKFPSNLGDCPKDELEHTAEPWKWEPDNMAESEIKNSDYSHACLLSMSPNIKDSERCVLVVGNEYDTASLEITEVDAERIVMVINECAGLNELEIRQAISLYKNSSVFKKEKS